MEVGNSHSGRKRNRQVAREMHLTQIDYGVPASMVHLEKSIGSLHPEHDRGLSNSSEKISFSLPHFGHLQVNDVKFLCVSNPGQC
jgi:hypothetical protein